jgi:glutamine synthetase
MNALMDAEIAAGRSARTAALKIVRDVIIATKPIRFEGNNYSEDWKQEAERRGLPHARNTVAALRAWDDPASKQVFTRKGILSAEELEARIHIRHEQYQKAINIEAQLLREIGETMLIPAVMEDLNARADTLAKLAGVGVSIPASLKEALEHQTRLAGVAQERLGALKAAMTAAEHLPEEDLHKRTEAFGGPVREAQESLRDALDQLEKDCAADLWPIPVYREMLAPLI